ncbi:arsenical pump-driving ATPase [Paucibacter sp. APW11]|uniref:Arsenical pump-driving ATPase n=1 Tax=Roseateles aquae TaxID=3077235 RepID=A0ABU3P8H7_9BURK|nr:arsenical pump-driving ATPase [Paucibacter sp. APW11]MDT8998870.1 arsenical pump-driving ATPase [Paucibacter sp. APW11]
MTVLDRLPRFVFFTGKGGVGKTSLACAVALRLAEQGRRVLLVSTDPASNVGQVFGQALANEIRAIDAVPGLSALEIDPHAAAQGYRERLIEPARASLSAEALRGMEEQLSGACTTEIAAFDEFTGLLTDAALQQRFDHVLFDTAPTGHTIRLLQLPGAWNRFLQTGQGDASCLGPLAGLDKQRERYQAAVDALADPALTRLVLVTRAQPSALREVARTHEELAQVGLRQQLLVVNGVMPEAEGAGDALAAAVFRREQQALAAMPAALQALPMQQLPLRSFDLVGLEALRRFLAPAELDTALAADAMKPLPSPRLADLMEDLAAPGHGLIMVMGKGGVGKTTLAAAIAVALAQRGLPVLLSTSDPAAHLTETLAGSDAVAMQERLPTLSVSRIDPKAETERYRAQVMASKGRSLDDHGRAMLAEDLRSPCTEEIAVFQAFSRAIREAGRRFVVMDTAPTGHTLLLLDATGAYHRDIARQMSRSGVGFTTPMMQLRDAERTKVLIVTLAENTPVQEAAQLQAELRRAGIEPWAWVVNNSLAQAGSASPLLQARALHEREFIKAVADVHASRYAVVPLLAEEPVGLERLAALSAPSSPG